MWFVSKSDREMIECSCAYHTRTSYIHAGTSHLFSFVFVVCPTGCVGLLDKFGSEILVPRAHGVCHLACYYIHQVLVRIPFDASRACVYDSFVIATNNAAAATAAVPLL